MRRAQRRQKIPRIEELAGCEDARPAGMTCDDTLKRFDDKRCGGRVDVAASRDCAAFRAS